VKGKGREKRGREGKGKVNPSNQNSVYGLVIQSINVGDLKSMSCTRSM